MGIFIPFALNHITAPRLESRSFIDLAASLGCIGVELRNDLVDKSLSSHPFFDGEDPVVIGAYARKRGVRLLGLSEIYAFNDWGTAAIEAQVRLLIDQAVRSGAETISLIPRNDGATHTAPDRATNLKTALGAILPMVEEAGLIALIEPLGFTTSSLRYKREAVEAIEAVGGEKSFRLVHDTFHHHLAGETEYFPEHTGIVHISGVVDKTVTIDEMRDEHRGLIDGRDRLGNATQMKALIELGYAGAFSLEPFSPAVHDLADPEIYIERSLDYLRSALA